jgi:tryptophanase
MSTIIEPFRIHSVQPLRMTTPEERRQFLDEANQNLFELKARDVLIDLLTDSGTGAMSCEQWAAVMRGDESYAGSESYGRFERAVQQITGLPHVIPTHQGRAAEHLLFSTLLRPGDVVPNNTHFDTTRANVESAGGVALDIPCAEAADLHTWHPFKGDMDVVALERLLSETPGPGEPGHVPMVMLTVTNNAGGGQPVSLANLTRVSELCRAHNVPLVLDACRFAENAYLVKCREPGLGELSVQQIVTRMFDLVDGCTMSAKKEGLGNIGGFLAGRDGDIARLLRQRLVVTEGFPTYGGMAGRDLDAVAQGLHEVLDEAYQEYRHASIKYVCEGLHAVGVPVMRPAGGHAIFLDAERFLPHLPWQAFPGQALALELYLEGGVRSCEIGSLMLGRVDPATGEEQPAPHELVRLAIPRRTYTKSHMDYVIEVLEAVWARRHEVAGVAIVEAPAVLRHFTAKMRRLPVAEVAPAG